MRMQQNLVSGDRQIVITVAAPQHGFPNPDIQIDQTRANPIRSFAATVLSVSHADEADTQAIGFSSNEIVFARSAGDQQHPA